jgi:hypothetical protein
MRGVANVLGLMVRDERREDADALRARQLENFTALLAASRDFLASPDGQLAYLNPAAREAHGLGPRMTSRR